MSAVEITHCGKYLTQFSGYRSLSRSGIARQYDVHRHLLMLSQSTFCTLQTVLHRVGHLPDGTLHLVHSNILVEVLQYIVDRPFLRHIALYVSLLYLIGISSTADEVGEDVLGSIIGQMAVSKLIVLDLDLIFEET